MLNGDVGIGCLEGLDYGLGARDFGVGSAGGERDLYSTGLTAGAFLAAAETAGLAAASATSGALRPDFLLNLMGPPDGKT